MRLQPPSPRPPSWLRATAPGGPRARAAHSIATLSRCPRWPIGALLCLTLIQLPVPLGAQPLAPWAAAAHTVVRDPGTWSGSDLQGELLFTATGALVGGLTAGLTRALHGEAFWPAFLTGSAGGALAYAGRRLGAQRFAGAGLLGRELGALGASVVANGAAGRDPLASFTLPVGPLELLLAPGAARPARLRLNAWSAFWTTAALVDRRYRLDGNATLSHGTPVFRRRNPDESPDGRTRLGATVGGVVFLEDVAVGHEPDVLTHEWSHVAQGDYLDITLGAPLELAAAARVSSGRGYFGLVRPGLLVAASRWLVGAVAPVPYPWRPLEMEAAFLESR